MNTLAELPVYPAFSFTIQPSLGGTCMILTGCSYYRKDEIARQRNLRRSF